MEFLEKNHVVFDNDNKAKDIIFGEKVATKKGIVDKKTKLPSRYNRIFLIYMQETDLDGNKVVKKELYDGSQKRFMSYVPSVQK